MKKIIVTTDFSTSADNAVNFAVQSSKLLGIKVILLHAFELKGSLYTDYMGVNKEFNQDMLIAEHKNLEKQTKAIAEKDGVQVIPFFFKGIFNDAIKQAKKEHEVSLIIMGSRGHGIAQEKLWGNKTTGLIAASDIPVMVVPPGYTWSPPKKILLTTYNFEKEPAILDFVFELNKQYKSQMQVAVFTDEDDDMATTFLEHNRQLPLYQKYLTEKYQENTLVASNVIGTEFEDSMQTYIQENKIDIMVMITYQRNFWDRLFHPSRTRMMSFHTKIPLLAIPAK